MHYLYQGWPFFSVDSWQIVDFVWEVSVIEVSQTVKEQKCGKNRIYMEVHKKTYLNENCVWEYSVPDSLQLWNTSWINCTLKKVQSILALQYTSRKYSLC